MDLGIAAVRVFLGVLYTSKEKLAIFDPLPEHKKNIRWNATVIKNEGTVRLSSHVMM